MRELTISPVPGRKGTWLVVENGSTFYPVAKFRDEAALEEFRAWIRDNDGKTLRAELADTLHG